MVKPRELFVATLTGQADGAFLPFEFMEYWPETAQRWKEEAGVTGDLCRHFGLTKRSFAPVDFNAVPAFEEVVLEETDTHQVIRDVTGVTKRVQKNTSAMPHYIDFPIKDRRTFEQLGERLTAAEPKRYPADWPAQVRQLNAGDEPVGLIVRGPFAFCRDFIHFEDLMMMVYDQPKLIADMAAFQGDFIVRFWDKALRDLAVDFIYIGEDMGYKNGPMFSPSFCREVFAPQYRRITEFLKSRGVRVIILDSDGDVRSLIPMYLESGITCITPMERAAAMDPMELRRQYPTLQMIGGVDKLSLASGRAGIDEELNRIRQLAPRGGWIPSVDHSVPPIIAYDDYAYYISELKKIAKG